MVAIITGFYREMQTILRKKRKKVRTRCPEEVMTKQEPAKQIIGEREKKVHWKAIDRKNSRVHAELRIVHVPIGQSKKACNK